jgi:hypothetical protein
MSRRRALARAREESDVDLVDSINNQRVIVPFLDGAAGKPPPSLGSNLAGTERFDQILLLMRSTGGDAAQLEEYMVLDIPSLVGKALRGGDLGPVDREERIRQQISDHLPIWIRLKLPDPLMAPRRRVGTSIAEKGGSRAEIATAELSTPL